MNGHSLAAAFAAQQAATLALAHVKACELALARARAAYRASLDAFKGAVAIIELEAADDDAAERRG